MFSKRLIGLCAGLTLCYTTGLGEIRYQPRMAGFTPQNQYESSIATLSAGGLANIEVARCYNAAVLTGLLMKGEYTLCQALQTFGIPGLSQAQEGQLQSMRARWIEEILR